MASAAKKNDIAAKKCLTPTFRVSYPHMFEPTRGPRGNQEPKYQICMLFEKSVDISDMRKKAFAACVEKFGPDKTKWPPLRTPFRDGDKEKADQDGYKGHIFVNAKSKQKPGLIDQAKNPITAESGAFYAGCYARATLIAFVYEDHGQGMGVSFTLLNVQKVKDGKAFGGRRRAEDEFDALEDTSSSFDEENGENQSGESDEI